jgi:TonB-linked SusC/RagA family outer membrane protein
MINFKKTAVSVKNIKLSFKNVLPFLMMFLVGFTVNAQNRTVTGKVTNDKGEALGSATVEQTATIKTKTAADGTFSLSVPENAKSLTFSYVGYDKKSVSIAGKNNVLVSLVLAKTDDGEVIVTGYSKIKKNQFVGAATVISPKVFETVPVGAFDQTLQGAAPGLLVNSGSGQPGSSANLTIRGISSIGAAGAQPLYILDGIPIPSSDFQTMNANDFESIAILKDASASALYGSRGALGVIVLTSKKGKAGKNTFIYRTQIGFTQAPNPSNFNMMNSQEALAYEERAGMAGVAIGGPGWIYSRNNPTYASQTPAVQARRDFLLDSFGKNNVDYYKLLFRQGISRTHDINLSGGVDKTKYYLSLGLFDQEGIDLNSRLRRYTARFNLDQTIGKLNVQFNNSFGYSITNQNEGDFRGNSARNPFQIVWRAKPYENPLRADGSAIFGANTSAAPNIIGTAIEGLQQSFWIEKQFKINTGITLAFKVNDNITLKNVSGVDVASENSVRAINANSYVGSLQTANNGYYADAARTRANLINTSSAVFGKKFNKHEVELGAYFEIIKIYNKVLGFQLFNLDPRLTLTGQGAGALTSTVQNGSSAKSQAGIRSQFVTGSYTYDNRYTFTGNYRSDGTSRILNEANKIVNSYSVGLSWNATRENFFSKQNVLTDFKARYSIGQVPNINSIPTAGFGVPGGLYGASNYLGPQLPSYGTNNGFVGSTVTGLVPTTPGNGNLKIEYVKKSNIGFDIAAWKNRARVSVDIYKNVTKELFVSQPLASTTGFGGTSLDINAGTMSNKGVELTLAVDVVKNKDWLISVGFNHAINNNKIEDLGLVQEYPTGTSIIRKGLSYGSHYSFFYLGADPATGAPTYKKPDGTSTTNINDAGQFAEFGTYLPKHVGGFNADISYKRISVRAMFSYQFDVMRYNNVESWTTRGNSTYINAVNQNKILLTDQWRAPGDVKYYNGPQFERGFSSADIMDAKFLRFRNLNVSYQIPALSIKKFSLVKSAKFYIQGQNLKIWSPWRGLDPEDSNNISLNEFPNPKMVVVGLDINF